MFDEGIDVKHAAHRRGTGAVTGTSHGNEVAAAVRGHRHRLRGVRRIHGGILVDVRSTDIGGSIGRHDVDHDRPIDRSGAGTGAGDRDVEHVLAGHRIHGDGLAGIDLGVVGDEGFGRIVQQHHAERTRYAGGATAGTRAGGKDSQRRILGGNRDVFARLDLGTVADEGLGVLERDRRGTADMAADRHLARVVVQHALGFLRLRPTAKQVAHGTLGRQVVGLLLRCRGIPVFILWAQAAGSLAIKQGAHGNDRDAAGDAGRATARPGKGRGVDVLLGRGIDLDVLDSRHLGVVADIGGGGVENYRDVGRTADTRRAAASADTADTDGDDLVGGLDIDALTRCLVGRILIDLGVIADARFGLRHHDLDRRRAADSGRTAAGARDRHGICVRDRIRMYRGSPCRVGLGVVADFCPRRAGIHAHRNGAANAGAAATATATRKQRGRRQVAGLDPEVAAGNIHLGGLRRIRRIFNIGLGGVEQPDAAQRGADTGAAADSEAERTGNRDFR